MLINILIISAPKYDPIADILFIVDSSQSIGQEDYEKELNFVVGLTEHFNIGESAARFSVMLFSGFIKFMFSLGTTDHATIKQVGGGEVLQHCSNVVIESVLTVM